MQQNRALIEQSVQGRLSEQDLHILNQEPAELIVTGQPLHIFNANGNESHFANCPELVDHKVQVNRVWLQVIPAVGHIGLVDEAFIDDDGYPAMQCFDPDGSEIIFGIKTALGFKMGALQ